MKKFNKIIAKAYDRITRDYMEGAELDALFDAGEWSGPAIGRMMDAALARMAAQFGVTVDEAAEHFFLWSYSQDEHIPLGGAS